MTTPNTDPTGNRTLDEQAGGKINDDIDTRTGEKRSFEAKPDRPDLDLVDDTQTGGAVDDSSFHTSTVEANRSVEQGNGVGARELDVQADPNETETQADLDARADTSRDQRQTPLGQDAAGDTAANLGGER
jgi:hypothetical protein